MSIAMALHLLGVIVWVGGMFFAHMVMRPVFNSALEPEERVPLLLGVFNHFFPWVWGSVIAILASGFWMLFVIYENGIGLWLGFMTVIGVLMSAIFVYIYSMPYNRLGAAVKNQDKPKVVLAVIQIRRLILVNLILGLSVTLVAILGKYGLMH
ncbi:MAG: CopD family protein [Candidatus Thiodiazotropha sp.]